MSYGPATRAPASDQPATDPVVERALARAAGTWGGYQAWRQFDPELKLQLVEKALEAANDPIDDYPIAL